MDFLKHLKRLLRNGHVPDVKNNDQQLYFALCSVMLLHIHCETENVQSLTQHLVHTPRTLSILPQTLSSAPVYISRRSPCDHYRKRPALLSYPGAKSEEKRMFSQAKLRPLFRIFLRELRLCSFCSGLFTRSEKQQSVEDIINYFVVVFVHFFTDIPLSLLLNTVIDMLFLLPHFLPKEESN